MPLLNDASASAHSRLVTLLLCCVLNHRSDAQLFYAWVTIGSKADLTYCFNIGDPRDSHLGPQNLEFASRV